MIRRTKLPKLKDKEFLIIPEPLKGEVFSSWLIRLSYAHHTHPRTFINIHFGIKHRSEFKNNVDTTLSNQLLDQIKQKCKNKVDTYNLTLKPYSGYLQEDKINIMSNRLLCSMRFCPKCLREDKVPYFRKKWLFSFSTACAEHKCYLHDACPRCKKKLDIFKMYQDKLSDLYCYACGYSLKKAYVRHIHEKHTYSLNAIKTLHDTLDNGYIAFNDKVVYSFCFFDVIMQLTKLITNRHHLELINKHPLYKLLKNTLDKKLNTSRSIYLQLSIKETSALFGIVIYLFEDYPNNFAKYIKLNNLTHWDMMKDIRYVSFWYENLVNDIVPQYKAFGDIISLDEVKSAEKYLISKGLVVNKANLSRLFGNINFFSKYNISEK